MHILCPPGSPYPLEPPVVWISSGGAMGSDTIENQMPPFGEGVGAILCGAFAAHNALRLSRPLQQLSEYISSQAASNADSNVSKFSCAPQLLSVLSSPVCETSISDVAGLLLASWQMEAQLDELISKDPEGPRGMFARWVAISTGAVKTAPASPAPSGPPRRGANAAAEKNSVEEKTAEKNAAEQQKMQQYDAGSESRTSRAPAGGPTERGKREDGNVGAHSAGPLMSSSRHSTLSRTGGRLTGGEAEVCKTIIDGVKTAASAEALGLPVRQHFDSVMEFMANPRKRVLVVQGETGSGKTTQLPRMLLEAAAHLALQQQSNESNIMGNDKEHFPAYIVCTQPRRLAAVSVASRVATEMGAPVGGLVGYQVRLESRVTKHTRLLFCTHGVLLRQLLSSDALDKFSVVVVDEVHERCTEVDMLLLVLAKALASNKHNLKVVVMSASLAVEHFASYFLPERLTTLQGSCSTGGITQPQEHCQRQNRRPRAEMDRSDSSVDVLKVPGKTFPVSVHYLDEVLRMCDPSSLPAAYQSASAIAAAVEARYKGGRPTAAKTEWREQQQDTFSPTPTMAENAAATAAGTPVGSLPQLPQLVAAVVRHVHLTGTPCAKSSTEGTRGSRRGKHGQQHQQQARGTAIIVFCSGVGEVSAVCRAVEELQMDLWVLPCHASLHPKQQQKVFAAPPSGWRKVVVATNIAETSITISDVGYVIDCGTHKVLRYDPSKRSSRLQEELITKANAQQRRGRAGRVSEGCCLRLYQKDEFANMATVETPELHRQALDNVCLQLKAIFPKEPLHSLFSQCLDPPAQEHIDASIRHLEHLGALECVGHDLGESLTPLGLYLSRFPMSISFAKMLIFAAPLGCLEETLALCSLMAADSELYLPGAEAAAERQKYFARSQSDFVSSLRVFAGWESAVSSGRSAEDSFCLRFGVNASTCRAAEALRKRFRRVAREAGLMVMMPPETDSQAQPNARSGKRGSPATTASPSRSGSSSNAGDCASDSGEEDVTLRVEEVSPVASRGPVSVDSKNKTKDSVRSIYWYIKACVVAGLYPQVATIQAPRTYTTVGSGTLEKAPEAWQMKFFTRVDADTNSPQEDKKSPRQKLQRVFIHPTSVNFKSCDFDTQWVAFSEKLQTTKVFIKDVSTVSVFALLLLSCCELVPAQGEGALWLDGWLQLRCPGLICSYVKHLKGLFHAFLNEFYSLSAFGLTRKSPQVANQQVQQEALDYDAIAIEQEAAAPNKAKFAFFGARAAQQRRLDLTALVKRLVELEGHLI
ncbi:DEAH-box RNA/DNA helicase, putative [Eimeria necatrix]|uniref:RNA helicase n=1 Tax=Eimeria necatrix TaxID=51315 RepID=U6ML84_9EIME|nr:DEAH-box RNA/DNA helicase, putative [Eimeria necatrix]CDJ63833.1 DEAH-box RNA/DNA helicase, putative [Eimeria necatrix]